MDRDVVKKTPWQRGRLCADSACVELSGSDGQIHVRDSKNPDTILTFDRAEWAAFLGSAKLGDFDEL